MRGPALLTLAVCVVYVVVAWVVGVEFYARGTCHDPDDDEVESSAVMESAVCGALWPIVLLVVGFVTVTSVWYRRRVRVLRGRR